MLCCASLGNGDCWKPPSLSVSFSLILIHTSLPAVNAHFPHLIKHRIEIEIVLSHSHDDNYNVDSWMWLVIIVSCRVRVYCLLVLSYFFVSLALACCLIYGVFVIVFDRTLAFNIELLPAHSHRRKKAVEFIVARLFSCFGRQWVK